MTASGEDIHIRKRKRSCTSAPNQINEIILERLTQIKNVLSQYPGILPSGFTSKRQKVINEQISCKSSPSKINTTSVRRSSQRLTPIHQKENSSYTNSPSKSINNHPEKNTNKKELKYDCRLCEAVFNSKQSRNTHYTGTHAVENEKLLFFPDGSALVESSFEYHVRRKLDWLKAAAKRNMPSRMCKLCKVELDSDDLKWHYENKHKVIQMSKVKPIICLNNWDIKTVADPFQCKECPRTYDDITRLRVHMLSAHGGMVKCKFCKTDIPRKVYNSHVKKQHPNRYYKKFGINSKRVVARTHKVNTIKRATRFKCRCCPQKFPSLVAVRDHRRAMHKKAEISENKGKEIQHHHDNETAEVAENRKEPDTSPIPVPVLALLMYMCNACDLVTTNYDEAVAHSQDHILNIANTPTVHCEHCNLRFGADYQTHMQLHVIHDDIDLDSFVFVTYDYRLLMTNKWLDMFRLPPQVKIKIIESSVYFWTRCIRFKFHSGKKDASAASTLFKCVTCNKLVDPSTVMNHVKQQKCSKEPNSYPSDVCQRQFYNERVRFQHELTHKASNAIPAHPDASKYRIVLFNDQKDVEINKLLIEAMEKGVQSKESHKNVNLESNGKVHQETNHNVNLQRRAQVDQESNHKVNLERRTQIDQESNQNVNSESRAKVDLETNHNVNLERRAQIDQESNQNVNLENRVQVDQGTNQNVNLDSRAKVDQESNQNVNLKNRANVKSAQNVVTDETDVSDNYVITKVHKPNGEKVATVYKCKCKLCFHQLKCLFEHLEICTNLINETVKCKCGLVFNKKDFSYHCKIHCNGYTTIQVKEIIVREGEKIDIDGTVQSEYKQNDSSLNINNGIGNINKENSKNLNAAVSVPNQGEAHNLTQHFGSEIQSIKKSVNFGKSLNLRNQQSILERNNDNVVKKSGQNHQQDLNREMIILIYNYLKETYRKSEPPVTQEPMEMSEDREDNSLHDDNGSGNIHTDVMEENQSLVASTIEAELKEGVVANPEEGRITDQRNDSETATNNQIVNTKLVDSASLEKQDYKRQLTEDRSIESYARDSIKKYKTPKHNPSLTPRFSKGIKDEEIDEYQEEELLKEPYYTSCALAPDVIELLLTDDED